MYEIILDYLNKEERARWRKNRSRAIVNLLLKEIPELKDIPKEKLCNFIHLADSYDRIFRQVLSDHKELRMADYEDKEILEQKTMLSLGYSPNYKQDIKQLSLIK